MYDAEGRRRGVVVISYLSKNILDSFQELAPLYQDRLRLLNAGGFWLRGAHSEDASAGCLIRGHFTLRQ